MRKARHVSNLEDHLGYWIRYVSNQVSHAFSLKIEKLKDEGMEVRIGLSPAARMGTELRLDWIDAFRR